MTMDTGSPFPILLRDGYAEVKTQHPGEGRRRWSLRVAHEFWDLPSEAKLAIELSAPPVEVGVADDDPFDELSKESSEIGILLRTDYSDENAWGIFLARLQEGEREFISQVSEEDKMAEDQPGGSSQSKVTGTEDEDDGGDEDEEPIPIFKIINPVSPADRAIITNISNLTALRLLNEVDIRKAPSLSEGSKRIKPANKLIDFDGWQEIYKGKNLWIYDTKSNTDQCVRVVSQQGEMYGTATGDSWRARVSHICELQVNLFSGAMKIDFGGLDRWDYTERQKNVQEANLLYPYNPN